MEFTGKTVEEAIIEGLKELNLTEDNAEITVKEEPTKGLFGRTKGKAVVEIVKKADGVEKAAEFVNKILDLMDLTAKTEVLVDGENPTINVIAETSSDIIGYRGEVLDAIQTLAGAVANMGEKEYKKLVVNCENYRERREETIIKLAHKLEQKATVTQDTDNIEETSCEPTSPSISFSESEEAFGRFDKKLSR